MTEPHLPASQIARIFRNGGFHAVYAERVNGSIVLSEVRSQGAVLVGNYDGRVSAGDLEQAAHEALVDKGK